MKTTNDKFLCHHSSWHGICHFPLMIPRQSLFQQFLMQETLCTSPLHSKNNTNTTKTKQIWGKKKKEIHPRIWQPDPKRIKTYSTKITRINLPLNTRFIPHTHSSKRWILARPAPITNRPLGAEKREKWRKKGRKARHAFPSEQHGGDCLSPRILASEICAVILPISGFRGFLLGIGMCGVWVFGDLGILFVTRIFISY